MKELYPTNDKKIIDLEPNFFDNANFEWCTMLRTALPIIKKELEEYNNKSVEASASFKSEYPTLAEGSWTSLILIFWCLRKPAFDFFPNTMSIFKKIENCTTVSFVRLSSGSVVKPHFGENNAYYRCHLGIDIPGKLPDIGFSVDGEKRSWGEGETLIFNDAKMHYAFNFTPKERTIMIFDVWRPEYMPYYKKAIFHQLAIHSLFFELKIELHCNPFNQNDIYFYNAKEKLSAKNFKRYNELYDYFESLFRDNSFENKASLFFFDLWDKAGGV